MKASALHILRAIAREIRRSLRWRWAHLKAIAKAEGRIAAGAKVRIHEASVLEIGFLAEIESGVILAAKPGPRGRGAIRIGARTYIGEYCNLRTEGDELVLGEGCLFAQFVSVIASGHEFRDRNVSVTEQGVSQTGGIVIGDGVWLGANSVILPGVRIGDGAIVAAGAIVTKDVEPFAIVAGSPARVIRTRS